MNDHLRDGQAVRQYPAAGRVNRSSEIHEASCHRDVGRVQRPDLVGPLNRQIAQKFGMILVARCRLAGTLLRCQGGNIHALHECADVARADLDSRSAQLVARHACAQAPVLQVQFVNAAHERQICVAPRLGQVVHRAPADAH